MRIRGGAGLGDAIYIRPIAEYFVRAGNAVTVCSGFSEVFTGSGADVSPFDRFNIDVLAHYVVGKGDPTTNQWQDVCRSAGVETHLSFSWQVKNTELVNTLRENAAGRPLVLVSGGRTPMGRSDGFGKELMPDRKGFDAVLAELDCYTVRIGKGPTLYQLDVDIDLNGTTSVSDLLDLGVSCDGVVGQCSFVIPLAEVFDKHLLAIWAAHGMQSNMHPYIKRITPHKVLSKKTSTFVIDAWDAKEISRMGNRFMRKLAVVVAAT